MENSAALSSSPAVVTSHSKNNFDFLRFLLAALVILAHSFALYNLGGQEPLSRLTGGQEDFGGLAVDGFFAISGFLITASWLRSRGFVDYLKKRVLRIYPGFVVASLVCGLIVAPMAFDGGAGAYFHALRKGPFILHTLLLDKLVLPDVFVHNPLPGQVNGSLWTIKIEFECYLMTAALGLATLLRRRVVPLLLLVMASAVLLINSLQLPHLHQSPDSTLITHIRFVDYFLAGMVYFLYRDRIVYRPGWLVAAIAALAAASLSHLLVPLMPIPFTYLLMYCAFSPAITLHNWGKHADLSYGVYLYAWPVQQLLVQRFQGALTPYTLTLAALPLTVICATASWYLVEKPSLSLKPKQARPLPVPSEQAEVPPTDGAKIDAVPTNACA